MPTVRSVILGGILVLAGAWIINPSVTIASGKTAGDFVAGPFVHAVGGSDQDAHYSFRVETPPLTLTPGSDGWVGIDIKGFGARERRPGVPDIPSHTFLIAIPPGAVPHLDVRAFGAGTRPGVMPRPVATRRVAPDDEQARELALADRDEAARTRIKLDAAVEESVPLRRAYAGDGTFPRSIAWLGETGTLRDQQYVQVHVAPVRWDPSIGGLRTVDSIELTVRFDGARRTLRPPVRETLFEQVYEQTFVNYDQGPPVPPQRDPGARRRGRNRQGGGRGSRAAPHHGARERHRPPRQRPAG